MIFNPHKLLTLRLKYHDIFTTEDLLGRGHTNLIIAVLETSDPMPVKFHVFGDTAMAF